MSVSERAQVLTSEQERWAEAATIHRQHGERARVHVAEQIGRLALAGDQAGIRRWSEIAARLDQLMRGGTEQ